LYNSVFLIVVFIDKNIVKKIATTDTPPEAVAEARQKIWDKNLLTSAKKVVLLENIKDVGNLGTIVRTCVAFGVDAIILYRDCADIYNPKCVRASTGSLFKIPVFNLDDLSVFEKFNRIATLPRAEQGLRKFDEPWLLMFGSEAEGLSEELTVFSTQQVKIEMPGDVESLNLAISAGIILHSIAL
jgi:TrmH family RNA methyltransferase